jgi:3D (Asp-Asp-Asp) domain-containing protein
VSFLRSMVVLLTVLVPLACAANKSTSVYTATAYSVEGETASGAMAKKGIVAADNDVLPLGTRIRISGAGRYSGEYTVGDTGRKISGREVDIYISNDAEAKRFGKKRVRVTVLSKPK